MISLKQKTLSGLKWSFIESFANQGIQLIVGIILARILSPREFGLIGMLTIFIAVSQTFIDSGFSNSLIRKKNCSEKDYSTVFYFNLLTGITLYLILFFSSGPISRFFDEPQLRLLIQALGLSLIMSSFSIVQRTILIKAINFRLLAKITLFTSFLSGIIAIIMALQGYGVWSLVTLTLCRSGFNTFFLWIWSKWKPILEFSKKSFNELFSFGGKLLLSSIIDTVYNNVYYLIIGKYFSAAELGYYTRANQFKSFPSQNINTIIERVSYPVLAEIQNDKIRLRDIYRKQIKSTMLLTFVLMLGLAAVSKPMIFTLIGEKWEQAGVYLQLLCFVGMFYPLHALNLNMLKVQGRSDLFLRLEIIKKILAIPIILIGIFYGIKTMILGMIVNNIFSYYLNSYWSGRMLNYSMVSQVKDILPSFILAVLVNSIVFLSTFIIQVEPLPMLMIQIALGAVLTIIFCEIVQLNDYLYLKKIILEYISSLKNKKDEQIK